MAGDLQQNSVVPKLAMLKGLGVEVTDWLNGCAHTYSTAAADSIWHIISEHNLHFDLQASSPPLQFLSVVVTQFVMVVMAFKCLH